MQPYFLISIDLQHLKTYCYKTNVESYISGRYVNRYSFIYEFLDEFYMGRESIMTLSPEKKKAYYFEVYNIVILSVRRLGYQSDVIVEHKGNFLLINDYLKLLPDPQKYYKSCGVLRCVANLCMIQEDFTQASTLSSKSITPVYAEKISYGESKINCLFFKLKKTNTQEKFFVGQSRDYLSQSWFKQTCKFLWPRKHIYYEGNSLKQHAQYNTSKINIYKERPRNVPELKGNRYIFEWFIEQHC